MTKHKTYCKFCNAPLVVYTADEEVLRTHSSQILNNTVCNKCKERIKQYKKDIEERREEIAQKMSTALEEKDSQLKFIKRIEDVITTFADTVTMILLFLCFVFKLHYLIPLIVFLRLFGGLVVIEAVLKKQRLVEQVHDAEYDYLLEELRRLKHDYNLKM